MPRHKPCLGYKQAYEDQNTKAFQFQNFSLKHSPVSVLEGLRELTVLREAAVAKPPAAEINFEEKIHQLVKYVKLLHDFVDKSDSLMDPRAQAQLSFDWTLPQSSSSSFHSLHGVALELALVLMLYVAALRQQADAISLRTCDAAVEEPEDFAAAARIFQTAAGILDYVAKTLLQEESQTGGKLRQALPQLVRAMGKACLGEAQAVIASRAEARKSPPNLIAALHGGASELFESAAAELRPNGGQIASQRFRMVLALSSELHQVRARLQIAAQQSKEGHPGGACADLLDARKRLNDARLAVETDLRWKEMFAAEEAAISAKMPVYEQERQVVSIERIAPQRSKAPDAKVLAKLIEYIPEKLTVEVF